MSVSKAVEHIILCLINDTFMLLTPSNYWIQIIAMKAILLFISIYLLYCEGAVVTRKDEVNDRPIIGILSQEQSHHLKTKYSEENYTSYIAASYVKDVEASGAQVVPIFIGKHRDYYEQLMRKINGVLFPGGATYFNNSNGYADAGQHIYEIAQELNNAGDYFPLFGTCLGFELMIILASGRSREENRVSCRSFSNQQLHFVPEFLSSKMFKDAPNDVVHILQHKQVTVNSHHFCILDANIKSHKLDKYWFVTSHSTDDNGKEFVSSIEHKRYPFYGVQFHPEKSAFEWKASKYFSHTAEAVRANRYFMDFFIGECRKNAHSFPSEEEKKYVIYNYQPSYTGLVGSAFLQCYFFEPRGVVHRN